MSWIVKEFWYFSFQVVNFDMIQVVKERLCHNIVLGNKINCNRIVVEFMYLLMTIKDIINKFFLIHFYFSPPHIWWFFKVQKIWREKYHLYSLHSTYVWEMNFLFWPCLNEMIIHNGNYKILIIISF